jgi:DNA-binding NtrC family response regulator
MTKSQKYALITGIRKKQPSILLVEGDRQFGLSLSMILSEQGYEVTLAHESNGSFRASQASKADLIILDHRPPVVDGIAALRKMKGWRKPPPVLVINGWSDEMAKCLEGIVESVPPEIPSPLEKFLNSVASMIEAGWRGTRVSDPQEEFWSSVYAGNRNNIEKRFATGEEAMKCVNS